MRREITGRLRAIIDKDVCAHCGQPTYGNYESLHRGGICVYKVSVQNATNPATNIAESAKNSLTIAQSALSSTDMINQTLEEAIEGIVETFVWEEENFSIYNITISLRDLLNQGYIRINGLSDTEKPLDLEDDTSEKVKTQELPHRLVGDTFKRMLQNGDLDCQVISRGVYTIYGKGQPKVVQAQTTQQSATNQTPKSAQDYADKIEQYLLNKGSATLKQIQSRLKQKGITCESIEEVLKDKAATILIHSAKNISKVVAQYLK